MTTGMMCASCGIGCFTDEELCPICAQAADADLLEMAIGSIIGRYDLDAAAAKQVLARFAVTAGKPVEAVAAQMVELTREAVFTEVKGV